MGAHDLSGMDSRLRGNDNTAEMRIPLDTTRQPFAKLRRSALW